MSEARRQFARARTWVVKVGSALITNNGQGVDRDLIARWVEQIAHVRAAGVDVILVSSGAVAEGMARMGLTRRPKAMYQLQAAAALGQMGLVQTYESMFKGYGLNTAQVLLTHDDLADRRRYLNARSVLRELLRLGAVPVVNENDTVANEEIQFGDNDTLAALVANLVEADVLTILTDQAGLFDRDPRSDPDARLIPETPANNPALDAMAGGGPGLLGRGGMSTKVRAARLAARSGAATVVAYGREPDVLSRLQQGEPLGTLFTPDAPPLVARKQWLAGHLRACGTLVLDDGAVKSLTSKGASLLPIGVSRVDGAFHRGELVICVDPSGAEVARGLVNYSADEARRIIGRPSHEIAALLGYEDEPELIHRDNMMVSRSTPSSPPG